MLTLKLTLDKRQVTVRANELQSHSFSLRDLILNDAELKAFVLNPRVYGSRLFQALFKDGSAAKEAFDELSKQTVRMIALVLDSTELDGVAWEYAYNEVKQEYVVEDCAFMRTLPESERPANGRLKEIVERVSLLFIPANPLVDLNAEPMRALDVDGEWREMTRHITVSHAPFDLLQLRPATPEQLQTSMAHFHDGLAVHFSGHGAAMKDGTILLFECKNGASNPLGAQEFIRTVKDKAGIVFLSACQSAAAEKTEFGNLARGLVKSGVPFALGMQFNLPDPFAPVISGQFYNWLAQGHAIPEATRQARRAVKRENEFFVGMIALYAAHPDETGKLNWRGSGASLVQTVRPADVSDLPSPASGLIGRQHELMRIGTQLIEGKKPLTVTLHGAGGIGKTALLWQSLLRFAPSFELTLALALDPLPSLESILGRIERFLGLPSPCANETKEREKIVRERLTSKSTLLGLDNFETLNYALNEKDSDEEKTSKSLHAFFKSLAANGVTLCVTSREVTNLPGETIEDIQGLTNENGGRLFQENVVRQKDEIYIEKTQQVSEMVGGHPLALRLLASAFDDQIGTSLDQYIEDLQSHLPKAHDKWTEEDRHESLRASFDFTMNNLVKTEEGKELQVALSRLSVFIAFFVDVTAAPVVKNGFAVTEDEGKEFINHSRKTLHVLWERGLLERITGKLPDEDIYLYRLHPSINIFAAAYADLKDLSVTQKIYINSIYRIADRAYPANEGGGIFASPLLSLVVRFAMPDMLKASRIKENMSGLFFYLAFFYKHFGDSNTAMHLYQQAYEIYKKENDLKHQSYTMLSMAQIIREGGDLNSAMNLCQQAFNILEELANEGEQGKSAIIVEMAEIHVMQGDLDKAMKFYRQSLEIIEKLEDLKNKPTVLAKMAGIYLVRGDLDRAKQLYLESLEINKKLGNLKNVSTVLFSMAKIFRMQGDLDKALNLYHQSLEIMERLGDIKSTSTVLTQVAYIHRMRGDLDRAMQLYQQSLEIDERLGDLAGKAATLHEAAYVYQLRGDLDRAIALYQQSLEIKERLGNLKEKHMTLFMMADIYTTRGDLDGAMNLYQQALKYFEGMGDLQMKSASLHQMARIAAVRGDLSGSMILYQRALEDFEKLGDLKNKATTLHSMANVYLQKGSFNEAINLYRPALEIFERFGDLKSMTVTLREIINIYLKLGNLNEAMNFYQKAYEVFDKLGDFNNKAATLHEMGYVFLEHGDSGRAKRLFQYSLEIRRELDDQLGVASTLALIAQIDAKEKNYKESLGKLLTAMGTMKKLGKISAVQSLSRGLDQS